MKTHARDPLVRSGEHGANALVLRGVRRQFGERVVLNGLDLVVPHSEFVALLGHSGTGKSTLLRIIADLDREAEGEVFVPDRTAMVFQDPRLVPWKRVLQNVTLGVTHDDVGRAREVLEDVGLTQLVRAWPVTLSGGEAQRVALARALIRQPELLLLDEPFGSLDALTRLKMHALLAEMCVKYQPTVLLVTHDVEEALLFADRVVVLSDGHFVFDSPVELDRPRLRTSVPFQAMRTRVLASLGVGPDGQLH